MILENCNSLESYFLRFILNEYKKLAKGEFKQDFDSFKQPCQIRILSGSDVMWRDMFQNHHGHIRRDYISKNFQLYDQKEYTMIMSAYHEGVVLSDGTFRLTQTYLDIHTVALDKFILDNIADLDHVKKLICVTLRHEIGHLIDYIRFDGLSFEEYKEYWDKKEYQYNEFFEWKRKRENIDWEEELRRYYSIETESIANRNGGITINDILEVEKPRIRNMDITIDISVIDKKPKCVKEKDKS